MTKQAGNDAGQDDRRDVGQNRQRLYEIIVNRPCASLVLAFVLTMDGKAVRAASHRLLHKPHGALGALHDWKIRPSINIYLHESIF
jgi:hypothetical protein